MIVYLDTSALVPLLVEEAGTPIALRLWRDATQVACSRLVVVEAAAAIAMGRRAGRLSESEHDALQENATRLIRDMTLIEAYSDIVGQAAELAVRHSLRGYDATHLATATRIRARDVLFASGDRMLLRAANDEGFTTIDTSVSRPDSQV
ncbi:type II toxin-antitoxin system VapC family toxin [Microbacterium sp. NPDC089987]|uniref:type II toxin-antitoxin system VapC family toxin n=1 Tax=Microbacterium sp. NPDC089987 TaxID=3364202 RepID=UPI00381E390A